jgi:toxin ParE1/3/4
MRVIYHPAAEAEIIEAAQFYARRVSGLEVEFLDAIDQAVAAILEDPKRWQIIEADVRRYLMPRFPFAIYLPRSCRSFANSDAEASQSSSSLRT